MNQKTPPALSATPKQTRKILSIMLIPSAVGCALLFIIAVCACIYSYNERVAKSTKDEMQRGVQPGRSVIITYAARAPDAWDKGYDLGYRFGQLTAISAKPVPTAEALRAAASRIASDANAIPVANREEFANAFYSGFAQGYNDAPKPVL